MAAAVHLMANVVHPVLLLMLDGGICSTPVRLLIYNDGICSTHVRLLMYMMAYAVHLCGKYSTPSETPDLHERI